MNRRVGCQRFLAVFISFSLAFYGSADLFAQARRAGQVTARIPAGQIERPSGALPADPGTAVLWDDLVTTNPRGRVRLALDDGSILNVGSDSSLRVVQHDATTQQSDLVLTFGQMRVRTQLAQPNARFTVRTNTATLGVIGTDFWVLALPTRTVVIVFEGAVTVTSLVAGLGAVNVGAGQQTSVGVNQPPASPSSPTPTDYQNALNETNVGEQLPDPPGPRPSPPSKLPWIAIIGLAVVATILPIAIAKSERGPEEGQVPPRPTPPPEGEE